MQQFNTLIRTKYHQPFIRPGLVPRPRLQTRITEGIQGPLTLIIAPAGFGKTTLVAASLAGCPMPVAWLSLDRDDNQAGRFLNYLIAAFQSVDKRIGSEAVQLLAGINQALSDAVMTSLINDLDAASGELALVLDDYQLISAPEVHAAVAFLLDHCPQTFHLLIATRSDPPLPLARLRARGQLVELRAADLRFTEPEAAQFLNELMGLRLDAGSIAVLEERTEGWVAGLQMASIALQSNLSLLDQKDVRAYIERFSGTNRYILDYMLEEVLASQPPEIQHFLLYTSILKRLTAPLCDAILDNEVGGDDRSPCSEARFLRQSASILDYLEKANLFLAPLDDERIWYRYHHLFADLLKTRLKQSQPGCVHDLYIRASEWFERNGFILEAVQYAFSAKDFERAAGLIEREGPARWSVSDSSLLMRAGDLPPELLRTRPRLGLYQAWLWIAEGRAKAAMPLLHDLAEHLSAESVNPQQRWMRSFAYLLLAYLAQPAPEKISIPLPDFKELQLIPDRDLGLHNTADVLYAMLLCRREELEQAAEVLLNCIQRDEAAGGTTAIPLAIPFLARLRLMQGKLHEAANLCREYLKPITRRGHQYFYAAGSLNIVLGETLREWNDLEGAEQQIRAGIQANEPWNNLMSDVIGYSALARVQQARGDLDAAFETARKLDELLEGRTKPPDQENELRSLKIRLCLEKGDLASAAVWASQIVLTDPPDSNQELDRMTVARLRVAQGKFREAQTILESISRLPGAEKRTNRQLKINLLMAVALSGQNLFDQALRLLESSLTLAEPDGHIRVFLNEGRPMQFLLAQWLAHANAGPLREYAVHLLSQFDAEPQGSTAAQKKAFPITDLVESRAQPAQDVLIEPLSQRELEVLHLMARGSTNEQIARQLIVATGTVKAHAASIYRKLDVANRTEAVACARQLRLLP